MAANEKGGCIPMFYETATGCRPQSLKVAIANFLRHIEWCGGLVIFRNIRNVVEAVYVRSLCLSLFAWCFCGVRILQE